MAPSLQPSLSHRSSWTHMAEFLIGDLVHGKPFSHGPESAGDFCLFKIAISCRARVEAPVTLRFSAELRD